jgi:hypothetical protein
LPLRGERYWNPEPSGAGVAAKDAISASADKDKGIGLAMGNNCSKGYLKKSEASGL